MANPTKTMSMSKDLQAMTTILKDFQILEHESGVENHMLEFTNRYVTTIIEDALLYSQHAKKKGIDLEDIKLAIELQQDKNFATPPSREITAELARQRNSLPLPTIRSSAGLRLPPDRHSLTASNFQLKSASKKRTVHTISRVNVPSMSTNQGTSRPSFNAQQKPTPCPIIKFSGDSKGSTPTSTLSPMPTTSASVSSVNSVPATQIFMPTIATSGTETKLINDVNSLKRPHEEDDDYDN